MVRGVRGPAGWTPRLEGDWLAPEAGPSGALVRIGSISGAGSFLSECLSGSAKLARVQLPFPRFWATADSLGNVYVLSVQYSRLQQYDRHGRFIRGWLAETKIKQDYRLLVDTKDRVHAIGTVASSDHLVLKPGEGLRRIRSSSRERARIWRRPSRGVRYEVRSRYIYPRVVRVGPTGERTVVRTPFWLWLFQSPFPALGFLFSGLVAFKGLGSSKEVEAEDETHGTWK